MILYEDKAKKYVASHAKVARDAAKAARDANGNVTGPVTASFADPIQFWIKQVILKLLCVKILY